MNIYSHVFSYLLLYNIDHTMTKKIPVTPVLTTRRRSPRGNNNLSPLAPDTNSTEPTSTPIITNITTNTTTMVDNLQPSPTNNKAYNIQPVEDSMNQDDQTSSPFLISSTHYIVTFQIHWKPLDLFGQHSIEFHSYITALLACIVNQKSSYMKK